MVSALLCTACGPDRKTARISGKIKGVDQADILVHASDAADGDHGGPDTIKVKRGIFSYDRSTDVPILLTLVYPNFSSTTLIAEPGEEVHLRGEANRLKEVEVSGTESNKLLQQFRNGNQGKTEGDIKMKAEAFIRSHPQSMAAVAVFMEIFATAPSLTYRPSLELLDEMNRAQPDNMQLQAIRSHLRPQLLTAIGTKMPPFELKTISGTELSDKNLRGHSALILFSANWNGATYTLAREQSQLRRIYGHRLKMINICFDEDGRMCRERAHRDSLTNAVFAPGLLASPLTKRLGVRYIPGNLLLNSAGEIIDRDIPVEHLVERVKQRLH